MKRAVLNNLPELPFAVEESLNQLRISLGYCGEDVKTIMVTSSVPNEGKSFIAMNLWRMMANVGSKVVFIDCDLRNSVIRSQCGFTTDGELKGIIHYLAGKAGVEDVVYQTEMPNAFIVPVVTNVSNPSMLLEGKRFKMLIDACRQVFDYVIVDTPPLGSVADALNIAGCCDGNLLVVRSGSVPRRMVQDSMELLHRTGKPLLGVALNRVMVNQKSNSYYYKRYYSYGKRYYNKSYYYGKYGYGK